jgi:CoA:oxalate CoA-transferase
MENSRRVLNDIRVLDLSQGVPGPFCAKLLAGMGAEVIKIEPPGTGDFSRRAGPFLGDGDDAQPQNSALFLYLNTSKKGITLDLEQPAGQAIFRRLVQECDVLVEGYPPGFLDRSNLGYSALEELNAGLVHTSVTPFGQWGPYSDYEGSDLVAQAVGGLMCTIGLPDREPVKIGGETALYTTGMSAFSATMIALYVRDASGIGQHVDVSAMETIAVAQIHSSIHYQFGRTPVRRESNLVQAQDGWVSPGLETGAPDGTWPRVCELMGVPELAEDPRFSTSEARRENQADLREVVGSWAITKPKEEIYHTLQGLRTISGYVATVEELVNSGQLKFREFFQELECPPQLVATYPGHPFRIDDQPMPHSPAPRLGEHNHEIYCGRLGMDQVDLDEMSLQGVF